MTWYTNGAGLFSEENPEGFLQEATSTEVEVLLMAQAKSRALGEVNQGYKQDVNSVLDGYTQEEIMSFTKQEAEANSLQRDAGSPTPLLSYLSVERGMTVPELAAKVLEKASYFNMILGTALGKYRTKMTAINNAISVEELNSITW